MKYDIGKNLREVSMKLCEDSVNYNINLKEKDKSFKGLFEVKEQFIQLLKTYVKDEWVDGVKEENIELIDKEFTTVNIEERRADIIYKIKLKKQEIYFFLMEVQSKVDKMMSFRLYEYMMELYRKYIEKDKLPVIIPCVLYTGNDKWNVGSFKSLFNVRKEIERYIPDFEYILLDVNNYTDEELLKTCNLISSVFYLTKSKSEKEVVKRIDELLKDVKKLNEKEQKSLAKWARTMFVKKAEVREYISYNFNKEDDEDMALADLIPGAIEIWRQQGEERGKLKGELKAKLSSVKKILTNKLKTEPSEEVIYKLENMTVEELENIEDKIFEIECWDEILYINEISYSCVKKK